jgi:hypothetical protein
MNPPRGRTPGESQRPSFVHRVWDLVWDWPLFDPEMFVNPLLEPIGGQGRNRTGDSFHHAKFSWHFGGTSQIVDKFFTPAS